MPFTKLCRRRRRRWHIEAKEKEQEWPGKVRSLQRFYFVRLMFYNLLRLGLSILDVWLWSTFVMVVDNSSNVSSSLGRRNFQSPFFKVEKLWVVFFMKFQLKKKLVVRQNTVVNHSFQFRTFFRQSYWGARIEADNVLMMLVNVLIRS